MMKMTIEELLNVIPECVTRKLIGDYFDMSRYFHNYERALTQKGINLFYQEGKRFICVNGLYYLDELIEERK